MNYTFNQFRSFLIIVQMGNVTEDAENILQELMPLSIRHLTKRATCIAD